MIKNVLVITPAEKAQIEKFHQDVTPVTLPVESRTWLEPKKMGLDLDAGNFEFIDEGSHIWESYFRHWGWWKTIVLGWYPYTDLRDYYSHKRQGIGRPWLRELPEDWQSLIFRELILLITQWNSLVDEPFRIVFGKDEIYPKWVMRWLSITNASWRQGARDLELELYEKSSEIDNLSVAKMVQQYQKSGLTWRPVMPEIAVHHQRYANRDEYWTFER